MLIENFYIFSDFAKKFLDHQRVSFDTPIKKFR